MCQSEAEIAERREAIWQPYHTQLAQELARIQAQHGGAALWDAHSIRSVVPRFFEGKLARPEPGHRQTVPAVTRHWPSSCWPLASQATGYTAVLNGRFKGGHITRQYGNPAQGIHAVQLEMTQCSYMQESGPFDYLPEVAAGVQPHVRRMLEAVLAFVET
jgi:N-formylglutamate deformylase